MNRSSDTQDYIVSAGGIGTAPTVFTINLPSTPPRKGWIYELQLTVAAGPATQARAVLKVGGVTKMIYDDGAGGLINIDGTGLVFNYADIHVGYERGALENITLEVETDDVGATTTIQARLRIGGP